MKTTKFLENLGDLFLASDSATANWKSDLKLKKASFWLFGLAAIFVFINLLTHTVAPSIINPDVTMIMRLFSIIFLSILICLHFRLTILYYKFTVVSGNKLYLSNILIFFMMNSIFFGMIYSNLYGLVPTSFDYRDVPVNRLDIVSADEKLNYVIMRYEFVLFSAFQGVGGDYFKIKVNSTIVNVLCLINSLYVFSLVSIFVASFVNQNVEKHQKD